MRNIRRPEQYESLFKRFTETPHPISLKPIFATQRDFLCFVAVLGFHNETRIALDGKAIELDSRVFENNEQSRDLLFLIALAGSRDANILQPEREDDVVRVFEEYVSGGLKSLDLWMKECPDDHIGDQAILTALRRHNFFGTHAPSLEQVINEVEF
jgi:dnd system-associated protein 4